MTTTVGIGCDELKKEKKKACVSPESFSYNLVPLNDTCISDRLYNNIYTLNIKKLIIVKESVEV